MLFATQVGQVSIILLLCGVLKGAEAQSPCPSNWLAYDNKCYFFETTRVYTWNTSRDNCAQLDSVLVSIHSDEENTFVFNNNGRATWIGYFRRIPGGPFEWLDGSDKDYSNWYTGEPNNARNWESCAEFNRNQANFKWNDNVCSDPNGYVCVSDQCASSPCQNGGSCEDKIANYTCICADGYTGLNCEQEIDECASSPCQNGGSCEDKIANYTCTCADGYTGFNCGQEIDECTSSPCQNGGSCEDKIANYTCTCADGYTGFNCGQEIDECASSPCQNGGSCDDKIAYYTCTCAGGYTGFNCEQDCRVCFHCEASRDMEECEQKGSYTPCTSGNETNATVTGNGQNGDHIGRTADDYCPEIPQCITQYHNRGNNTRVEMYCLKDACIHKSYEVKLNGKCDQTRKGSPNCIEVNDPECQEDEQ